MQTNDINENLELVSQLYSTDLWEEKFGKIKDLEELINEKIKQFNLTVGQAFNFYVIIGEEDRNPIIFNNPEQEEGFGSLEDEPEGLYGVLSDDYVN